MHEYETEDILKIAKRINNKKRSYLLVDPLQAKHMPVSPSRALEMMESLGKLVAENYGDAGLVIGFAETATAIGAVVAKTISEKCLYIQTTREDVKGAKSYIDFTEEHSHATEQKLVSDSLDIYLRETETIIIVDDEFSTGKTLINMIRQLKSEYPVLTDRRIVAASVINRLSKDNLKRWSEEGIESVSLVKNAHGDFADAVKRVSVKEATDCLSDNLCSDSDMPVIPFDIPDPRTGITVGEYYKACSEGINLIKKNYNLKNKRVLILGTEECMLPALVIGKELEDAIDAKSIMCHATTRSPIGISDVSGYPVFNGFHIKSFYNPERDTFIYDLQQYDVAIIVSDTKSSYSKGLNDLSMVLRSFGCREIMCLTGSCDV